MRNIRKIKRISAIYLRVLEGTGTDGDPYRQEEYIYFDDEDRLFVVEYDGNIPKLVKEKE